MPTKKKRVGFIPRDDVMIIIDKLSIENNLSNSKIISILVEEALSIRGIFNKENGKATKFNQVPNDHSQKISDNFADFMDNAIFSTDTKLINHSDNNKSTNINGLNQEDFDFQTYKKFILFLKFKDMMDKYNT